MTSLLTFGEQKFPDAGLLHSSADREWRGVAAELRSHPAREIPAICPNQMEVTLAVKGLGDAQVERRGAGTFQQTTARMGTLWLCPIGIAEDSIRITKPLDEILHLYIPQDQFTALGELTSRRISPDEIFYLADLDDELVRQIALRVLKELKGQTAGGALLIEQLSLSLLTHLVSCYSAHGAIAEARPRGRGALDQRKLDRVIAYIHNNLVSDLTLTTLAEVACLSRHHFARAFREATGVPPHRFIGARRLDYAKRLLGSSEQSLTEIAFSCRFSSQASFTRAFHRRLGVAPGEYRRRSSSK